MIGYLASGNNLLSFSGVMTTAANIWNLPAVGTMSTVVSFSVNDKMLIAGEEFEMDGWMNGQVIGWIL